MHRIYPRLDFPTGSRSSGRSCGAPSNNNGDQSYMLTFEDLKCGILHYMIQNTCSLSTITIIGGSFNRIRRLMMLGIGSSGSALFL